MSEPELTVVIGANGAGETTWVREKRSALPKPFYNADSIAEGLGDANDATLQREARQLVDQCIRRDLEKRRTFGFESTYSGRSRPDIVRAAKQAGYTTNVIFLGTEAAAINISRVRQRVREGGHHVDDSEVRRGEPGAPRAPSCALRAQSRRQTRSPPRSSERPVPRHRERR